MATTKDRRALLDILFVLVGLTIPIAKVRAAGAEEWNLASESTATASTEAMLPFSGKGLVDGLILSSAAATGAYVTLRDTNTANASLATAFAPKLVVFFGTNTVTAGQQAQGIVYQFARPLRITNGLSVNASNCPTAPQICYTVLFRRVVD